VFELDVAGRAVIVKNVVPSKQQGPLDEFEALRVLQGVGVDAPRPLARVFTQGQSGFIVMDKLPGVSGRTIRDYFEGEGMNTAPRQDILRQARDKMNEIAETVRRDTGLDKPWRLKDFMIVFGTDASGRKIIERMLPMNPFQNPIPSKKPQPCKPQSPYHSSP
jgi:hypothetical protein